MEETLDKNPDKNLDNNRKPRAAIQKPLVEAEKTVEVEAPWYVIQTIGRQELNLVDRIDRMKRDLLERDWETPPEKAIGEEAVKADELFERCWVPTKTERRKYSGVYVDVHLHLFPGYVFVSTHHPRALFLAMRQRMSYLKILGADFDFKRISDEDEELIKRLTGWTADGKQDTGVSVGVIENGVLHVIEGPLKGMEDQITYYDRHKMKAWITLTLFNEERRFSFALVVVKKS